MDDFLVIDRVSKSFGSLCAVDDVTLSVGKGEAYSLLGPSGCGKTTLLRMIAGFERPDSGRILVGGQDITALPPEQRPVNTVFQNYALFPHLNVWENVAFGLRMSRRPREEIRGGVDRMLELVRLSEHARKRPAQLSGGQKQRVAIARALVNRPQVLLLDEPLAALDLKLRQHMLMELNTIHEQVGTTFIYVTHDQGEAMSLSDRIAVMNAGRVEQVDSPENLYETPRSSFVATFIGDANFFTGTAVEFQHEGYVRVMVEGLGSPLVLSNGVVSANQTLKLMVRPEKISLTLKRPPSGERVNAFRGIVDDIAYFGSHTRYRIRAGEHSIIAQLQRSRFSGGEIDPARGQEVWMSFHPDEGRVLKLEDAAS
ncbi:ABC transporter ATP-binding protein [Prosthecobacter sp.]|jgi:spermidine/putrescine transport system ATP-binding protein|uniref:ABC transporter ATP-binding protein n=1 Tax=Prosthecobacter sp. TaxID=1965333 RepID=UPI0037843565